MKSTVCGLLWLVCCSSVWAGDGPQVDVAMQKQVLPVGSPTFAVGAQALYTITVENLSPVQAQMVLVEDDLPEQVQYVSDNCGGVAMGQQWTWDVGDLNALTLNSCDILVDIIQPGVVINVATVSTNAVESDTSNNEDQAAFSILGGGPVNVPVNSYWSMMLLLCLLLWLGRKSLLKRGH